MKTTLGILGGVALLALGGAPRAQAADVENGKKVYTTNCQSCHGASGKGDGPVGSALNPAPRDFTQGNFKFDTNNDGETGTDADLRAVITKGAAAFGGSPLMAPWGHLPEKDIEDVIAYIRTLQE